MLSFSQRKGLKPIRSIIQIDGADDPLRNQLWNCLSKNYWNKKPYRLNADPLSDLLKVIWVNYYELRLDELSNDPVPTINKVKHDFLTSSWHIMYDILEFIPNHYTHDSANQRFITETNEVLTQHLSGYRFVNNTIVDITSEQEVLSIEQAISNDSAFTPVSQHLKRALELLADRKNPDYRNSIKESISAVESLTSIVTGNPKATLGQALAQLEKQRGLHTTLKSAFSVLYGWTSEADGIRHKMMEQSNLKQSDAIFMLVTCSAFVNYVLAKVSND